MREDELDQQITYRLTSDDRDRVANLASDLDLKESEILRAALRLGITLLEDDPKRALWGTRWMRDDR